MAPPETTARVLLYAIVERPVSADELPAGVQGHPLALLPVASAALWAVVSALPDPVRLHTPEVSDALDYDRALRALHSCTTVLPLRYGTVMNSAQEVAELLQAQATGYHQQLALLSGCDEFGIRALPTALSWEELPPAPAPAFTAGGDPGSGTSFLRARQVRYQREQAAAAAAESLAGRLGDALRHLACAQHTQYRVSAMARQSPPALSMSFLVPRTQREDFRLAFVACNRREVQPLRLFGPWPPYSFAAIEPASPPIQALFP